MPMRGFAISAIFSVKHVIPFKFAHPVFKASFFSNPLVKNLAISDFINSITNVLSVILIAWDALNLKTIVSPVKTGSI